jgi:SHS2 domain-containing protein
MFGYMTDLKFVEATETQEITAEGQDLESLLYHFMDEWLFLFSADPFFIPKEFKITHFDRENFKITSVGHGETFDLEKHTQGTEVKAITYSNMQIFDTDSSHECYVIIDI